MMPLISIIEFQQQIPQNRLQCNHKFDNDEHCSTPHLTDEDIQNAFLSAANKLMATKDEVITNGHEMAKLLFDTSELEVEQVTLLEETQLISDIIMVHLQQMQLQRADIKAFLQSFKELLYTLTEFSAEN